MVLGPHSVNQFKLFIRLSTTLHGHAGSFSQKIFSEFFAYHANVNHNYYNLIIAESLKLKRERTYVTFEDGSLLHPRIPIEFTKEAYPVINIHPYSKKRQPKVTVTSMKFGDLQC